MGQKRCSGVFGLLSCVQPHAAVIYRFVDVPRLDGVMRRGNLRRLVQGFPYRVLGLAGPAGFPRGGHPWQFDMGRWQLGIYRRRGVMDGPGNVALSCNKRPAGLCVAHPCVSTTRGPGHC